MGVCRAELNHPQSGPSNAGWVYISEDPDNAYNQVPAYWSAEGAAIVQQGVQAPFATTGRVPLSSTGGTVNPRRVSFRWRAVNGTVTHSDTDQNLKTGYRGGQLSIGAEFMPQVSRRVWRKTLSLLWLGDKLEWSVVQANARINFPDPGMKLVAFDQVVFGRPRRSTTSFNPWIRL